MLLERFINPFTGFGCHPVFPAGFVLIGKVRWWNTGMVGSADVGRSKYNVGLSMSIKSEVFRF
jgi:hypothetical protein